MARADARDDSNLGRTVLLAGDALSFLHEQRAEALMLELEERKVRRGMRVGGDGSGVYLGGVATMDGDCRAVNVQLAHHGGVGQQLRSTKTIRQ